MIIRHLDLDDIPAIIELANKAASEIESWGYINEDILQASLFQMLLDPFSWNMGVFSDDGEFLGGMSGEITPTWFNDRLESQGRVIYLDQKARGKGVALKLYQMFDEWCNSFDRVKKGNLRTTSGADISSLVRPLGYEKVGSTYSKRYDKCV